MRKNRLFIIFMMYSSVTVAQDSLYKPGPDSEQNEGVPKGTVTKYEWKSRISNNYREYYVYVPAQYDRSSPAASMVFQDGHTYVNENGSFRTPVVFDNLLYRKKVPVTIFLFVHPGHISSEYPEDRFRASNRADEYNVLDDGYATMLMDEIIPELKKKYNLSEDRKMHAIGGLSSGAICAFTAAWEHPEHFSKVLSHIGSYTHIRGGSNYPSIIRKHRKKDIKIFMQDGTNDLDNEHGNWWLANLEMEAAFKFKGYEYRCEKGSGTHSGKHGGSMLPGSLVWL